VKYYVYISDSKVDMLAAQVPLGFRERIAAELKVDLKVFSVSLAQVPSEETRYSKVALVARHLDEEGLVGTVDEAAGYVAGVLPMHWGPWIHHDYGHYDPDVPMVWFAGETEQTAVGLAGSMKHLLGETERSLPEGGIYPTFTSFSNFSAILSVLVLEEGGGGSEVEPSETADAISAIRQLTQRGVGAGRTMDIAPQPLEFLARRLFEATGEDGKRVLLGSPIYVAHAD
jgi:hypothetical protein